MQAKATSFEIKSTNAFNLNFTYHIHLVKSATNESSYTFFVTACGEIFLFSENLNVVNSISIFFLLYII